MVSTRKTPSRRPIVALDDSPGIEVVCDDFEEDTADIADQISVRCLLGRLFLHINCLGTPQFYTTLLRQQCHQPIPIQFCRSNHATFGPHSLIIAPR
jgi:hypothetical protein